MTKLKKIASSLMLVGVISAPINAYAFSDIWWLAPTQLANLAQWASDKAAILGQMAADQLETLTAYASTELSINTGMMNSSSAISATVEKQTGAMKELTQAKINYDATLETAKGAADAEDKFGSEVEHENMCNAAADSKNAAISSSSSSINGKALNAAYTRRDLYTSPGVAQKQVLDDHNKYCSDIDFQRGRCNTSSPAPLAQQDADLNAGTLLSPSNGSTYSDNESAAANDFIRIVTNPIPPEMLPKAFEKQPQGAAYVLASMVAAAQMSVARNSLTQIWSSNSADVGLSASTGGSPGDALSMIGVMKKFVYDRFVEPKWKADLTGMDTNGLLKEVAVLLAGQNWMDYQAYLQAERMEAVAATRLAIAARDHNEKRLTAMRSNISISGR